MSDNGIKTPIKEEKSSGNYLFDDLNIFDYVGGALFVAGPALFIANQKVVIFTVLLSAIGYVLLSWGRKT